MLGGKASAFRVDLAVERCDLYILQETGIACLLVEVAAANGAEVTLLRKMDEKETRSGDRRFEHCLGGDDYCVTGETRGFTLAEVLALHDGLRRIYPPFFDGGGGAAKHPIHYFPGRIMPVDAIGKPVFEKIEFDDGAAQTLMRDLVDHGRTPVAPWWRALLDPLRLDGARTDKWTPRWRQVDDDRMPTLVFLAVADPGRIARDDLVRLTFADGPGSGPPCAPEFLADFVRKHAYDRFAHDGTRYFVSSYTFVALAGTKCESYPPRQFNFALDVLQEHARRHYTHMFLITHMQRAALLMFSRWLSDAMHEGASVRAAAYRNALVGIRSAITEFIQRYWFSNVSNQEQARELFELMQKHAGTHDMLAEVQQESELAHSELEQIASERQQASALALNVFVAFATLLGVPIGMAQGLGAIGPDFKIYAPVYFGALAIAAALAFVVIALISTLHNEGRIGFRYVWRTLKPWRSARDRRSQATQYRRAQKRMVWLIRVFLAGIAGLIAIFTLLALDPDRGSPAVGCIVKHSTCVSRPSSALSPAAQPMIPKP